MERPRITCHNGRMCGKQMQYAGLCPISFALLTSGNVGANSVLYGSPTNLEMLSSR